jgi:hypothetical protein
VFPDVGQQSALCLLLDLKFRRNIYEVRPDASDTVKHIRFRSDDTGSCFYVGDCETGRCE